VPTLTLAQAINHALAKALDELDDVILLGEDIGLAGGVFRLTDGLRDKFGGERVVDTPVAESGIVGVGYGLAVGGLRPVLELQFMGFSYPAFDQVISHVSRIRNRSRHRFTAPLVIRIPYGGGIGAAEHHSESTEALYAHVPGIKVVVPSRPRDAAGLLRAAIEDPDPVVFLEPIRLYRAVKEQVPEESFTTPIGVAAVERPGTDVTLLAWGAMMRETRAAAELLEESGVSAEVVDVRSLVPLDLATITASVAKTGRAVVIHEAPRTAGFGAEIVAQLQERCLYQL
jgi:pyruvate dehydrogenase E1 component beta subunit